MQLSEISQHITNDIIRLVQQNTGKFGRYRSVNLEYTDPLIFDLIVNLKITDELFAKRDLYFKNIPSEVVKFEKYGFAIDGDSFGGDNEDSAEIEISIAVDPSQINSQKFAAKILDVVRHEVEHIVQRGPNFSPEHKVKIPKPLTRETAKTNYKYFILSDEIPAQVRGLEAEAQHSGQTVKDCAIDYLDPFLELGFITQEQIDIVLNTWKKWAIQHNIKFE
jgi:hypothetical protein